MVSVAIIISSANLFNSVFYGNTQHFHFCSPKERNLFVINYEDVCDVSISAEANHVV